VTDAVPVALACVAAFGAGLVDAVAGGGGLVQLPALLVLFPSASVPALLGTNKVASVAGTTAALVRYLRHDVPIPWRSIGPATALAGTGAVLGARLAARLPTTWMRPAVLVLLIGVAAWTLARRELGRVRTAATDRPLATAGLGLALGVYDGFFGPGTGTFLLFGLVALLGLDFLAASASAKVVNVATNVAAIGAFVVGGHVRWDLAVAMAACNLAGSRIGSGLALAHGAPLVRRVFLGVVAALVLRLSWDLRPS
jgi:uncharacterized membrane protein YfcA